MCYVLPFYHLHEPCLNINENSLVLMVGENSGCCLISEEYNSLSRTLVLRMAWATKSEGLHGAWSDKFEAGESESHFSVLQLLTLTVMQKL